MRQGQGWRPIVDSLGGLSLMDGFHDSGIPESSGGKYNPPHLQKKPKQTGSLHATALYSAHDVTCGCVHACLLSELFSES